MIEIGMIGEMQARSGGWRRLGKRIGFVPTMGCLHAGHMSLVAEAKRRCDVVVVSIFVNPTQFGLGEDLDKYPRPIEEDRRLCREAGVDAIFYPTAAEMYPADASTWVVEESLSRPLCGASRPTHFRGVTTVVAKLFLATLPDVAVFGRKDAQQALVIQRMVRDLNFPIEIIVAPIIREADGLAMSSRNRYLSADDRQRALAIHRGLKAAESAFATGERSAETLVGIVVAEIEATGGKIDYVECRRADTLELAGGRLDGQALIAVAARYGDTRLIDNLFLGG